MKTQITLFLMMMLSIASSAQKIDFQEKWGSKQLAVVTTDDWSTVHGVMNVYNWEENSWKPVLQNIPVTIGRTGLAWGKGLQKDEFNKGVLKAEGDGKSPAGIFPLTGLYGYEDISTKMDYLKTTNSVYCVDDKTSPNYNKIVNTDTVQKNWNSAEEMRRKDVLYKYGVFVGYNTNPVVAGGGSCIFMHIWSGSDKPTSGCTAMTEENIFKFISILDKSKNPLLVQIPRKEYEQMKSAYKLP